MNLLAIFHVFAVRMDRELEFEYTHNGNYNEDEQQIVEKTKLGGFLALGRIL